MKIFYLTKDAMLAKYAERNEKLDRINKELENIPEMSVMFAIDFPDGKTYYGTATHARTRITNALMQLIDDYYKKKIDVSMDDIKITYAVVDNPISELDKVLKWKNVDILHLENSPGYVYIEEKQEDNPTKIKRDMEFGWSDR